MGEEPLSSELCYHHVLQKQKLQICGVRAFIQSPAGLFVDLAVSPGVTVPSR